MIMMASHNDCNRKNIRHSIFILICMSVNDSLNRVKNKQASYPTEFIKANNSTCEVMKLYIDQWKLKEGTHGIGNNVIQD